ncbi:MAG: hypothetical protein ACK4OO_08090, partial [bacterium]
MRRVELRYLSQESLEKINNLIEHYTQTKGKQGAEQLFEAITELLPIEKLNPDTVRRRVEGYYFASEELWRKALASGKFNRQDLIRKAGLKPLSHYHYLTGSREPKAYVLTRSDY